MRNTHHVLDNNSELKQKLQYKKIILLVFTISGTVY